MSGHSRDASFRQHNNQLISPPTEIVPRDLRMKDKFLKHLTGRFPPHPSCARPGTQEPYTLSPSIPGPLYFSPKCSKHFHRLYHNTRDCTVPACEWQPSCWGRGGRMRGVSMPSPIGLPPNTVPSAVRAKLEAGDILCSSPRV